MFTTLTLIIIFYLRLAIIEKSIKKYKYQAYDRMLISLLIRPSAKQNFMKKMTVFIESNFLLHLTKLLDTEAAMFKPGGRLFFRNRMECLANRLM